MKDGKANVRATKPEHHSPPRVAPVVLPAWLKVELIVWMDSGKIMTEVFKSTVLPPALYYVVTVDADHY